MQKAIELHWARSIGASKVEVYEAPSLQGNVSLELTHPIGWDNASEISPRGLV